MTTDERRITLISRDPAAPRRSWNASPTAPSRLILLDSFTVLRYAIASHLADLDVDVERVILDGATSAADYLALLASVPPAFRGDLVLIREDGTGFLSAPGRGGNRVLHALDRSGLRFYLEARGLITGAANEKAATAAPRAPRDHPMA